MRRHRVATLSLRPFADEFVPVCGTFAQGFILVRRLERGGTASKMVVVVVLAVKELEERKKKETTWIHGRSPMHPSQPPPRERNVDARLFLGGTYISATCVDLFHRRYHMRRSLYVKIVEECEANSPYFTGRSNVVGLSGFSAYQNISGAMRVIAYGVLEDYIDEYLHIGEDTLIESVRRFAKIMISL